MGIRLAVIRLIAASCRSIEESSFAGVESLIFFSVALVLVWKCKVCPTLALAVCGVLEAVYCELVAALMG